MPVNNNQNHFKRLMELIAYEINSWLMESNALQMSVKHVKQSFVPNLLQYVKASYG